MVVSSREVRMSCRRMCFAGSLFRFTPLVLSVLILPLIFGCGEASSSNVVPPPPTSVVSVSVAPNSVTLGAGESSQLTATVTGTSNTAVTWSLFECSGPECGTITSSGLYTAPSPIPAELTVTITATSAADPTKFGAVTIRLMPIEVSITPPGSAAIIPSRTLTFAAAVQHDISNSGVTWALPSTCPSTTCGALSDITLDSVTYTAPATIPDPPTVMLTATSIKDTSKSAHVIMSITTAATSGLLEGDYAFLFSGRLDNASVVSPVDAVGHFYADSSGSIMGIEDVNLASGVSQSVPFTGTYSVDTDRRGSFTITTSQGTTTYRMTVDPSGSKGRFIEFDSSSLTNVASFGTGYFERQDQAGFSLSALSGPYALELAGGVDGNNVGAVGRFVAGASGTFSEGTMDVAVLSGSPESFTELTLTGSFNAPTSNTGRGTALITLTPAPDGTTGAFNFVYYVVSNEKILLMETDPRSSTMPVLNGQIRRQHGSFSVATLDAPTVFSVEGATWFGSTATVGRFVPDGLGSMTGVIDHNGLALPSETLLLNTNVVGSYSVNWNGRSVITLQLPSTRTYSAIAYLSGPNEGFLMRTPGEVGGGEVAVGSFKPQAAGPFTSASVSGSFRTNTIALRPDWWAENDSGLTTFDGVSVVSSLIDMTFDTDLYHYDFDGSYAVSANGRGTLTFTSPSADRQVVFWVVSPAELVGIFTVDPSDPSPVLLKYEK